MNGFLAVCIGLAAGASAPAVSGEEPKMSVKPTMQAAMVAAVALQPYLARPEAFRDPSHAQEIQGAIDTLAVLRHGFWQPKGKMTSTGAIATLFARQVELARREFQTGKDEAARLRLTSLTQMCLGCHLRQVAKSDFEAAARLVEKLELRELERARLFASTRRWDEATALWKAALLKPPANDSEAFEQAQALKLAVSVAIRGKDDPDAAIALLQPQAGRKELPGFMARTATGWLSQARSWKADRAPLGSASTGQLLELGHRLVSSTRVLGMAGNDEENFVTLSRAAAALDELLRREPSGPHRGEVLYLQGVLSATVDPPAVWQLEAMYLEACARENAGAPIGRTCVERLRERTWLSWQRSELPSDVMGTLGELSALNPR